MNYYILIQDGQQVGTARGLYEAEDKAFWLAKDSKKPVTIYQDGEEVRTIQPHGK